VRACVRACTIRTYVGDLVALSSAVGDPIVVDCATDPDSCHCKGSSAAYPCPPNTGGQNIWGPGGDHAFTLVQPVATVGEEEEE
jgi:hypothetical protein